MPSPRPRSSSIDELGGVHRGAGRGAIEVERTAPGAIEDEMAGDRDAQAVRIEGRGLSGARSGRICAQTRSLEDGAACDGGIARGTGDAAPVGVLAVRRSLDQAARHDRARDGPGVRVVARPTRPPR